MLPEQLQRIIGYFLEESTENLYIIEQGLLNLQNTVDNTETINQLIRIIHALKGGSAMLGFSAIQRTAHRLEDYLKILRECPLRVDDRLQSLLLQIFDTLSGMVQQVSRAFGLNQEIANQMMLGIEPVFEELNDYLRLLIPTRLIIRANINDQVYILSGYCQSFTRFSVLIAESFDLLEGSILREEQETLNRRIAIDVDFRSNITIEMIRSAIEFAGGIIGLVHIQRGLPLFTGQEYSIPQMPIEPPKTCIGCRYYYGRSDGGYFLNCTVYPSGPKEENCRDRETN